MIQKNQTQQQYKMKKTKNIHLPDLGEGIESAIVSEIPISKGQKINKDDTIAVLESDKASMEIPSDIEGVVKSINIKTGQEIKTGDLLITLETTKTTNKDIKQTPKQKEQTQPIKTEQKTTTVKTKIKTRLNDGGVYASPGVRKLARELEINLDMIPGSGEKGRITKIDLHGYIKAKMYTHNTSPLHFEEEIDFNQWGKIDVKKLTKIKTITGQRLSRAWKTIPHVTQFIESDVTDLEALRKKEKTKQKNSGVKVTMTPYLMKATVSALKEHPVFNSSIQNNGTNIVFKKYYNIGVAVDTKHGLVVPVIRDVDKKNIVELSKELMDVSERARNKKLNPAELKGGTFTISNLGGIGGSFFTPIINPPEVAILGISRIKTENNNEQQLTLPLSLSYDHRVVDGAAGAAFMVFLSNILNNPQNLN
ncbi:MAG: branched-chain alpha-keto acid dehydrogenase subunit E2 [Candidatus Marinimicrobia bacterium]|nr:branched-chain alpha-keto acid dehydrogenase subunit E2 [Candidatus Neomarinimicrobiota bacterium]